ncbi:MAG: methylated-DNA--[protein]-cysteine S-methyltransferase [Terriglobia bacterium]
MSQRQREPREEHSAARSFPVGQVTVVCSEKGLRAVNLRPSQPQGRHHSERLADRSARSPNGAAASLLARQALAEIAEYLAGRRRQFTVPLDLAGTPFQLQVWKALRRIPYGETRSYGEIARAVGRPKAARAVGMANHSNPVAIIVPCHRVIAANGSLGGYAAGLGVKSRLLHLETANGSV